MLIKLYDSKDIYRPGTSFSRVLLFFRTAADKALEMTVHDKQYRDAHTFTEMKENTLEAA